MQKHGPSRLAISVGHRPGVSWVDLAQARYVRRSGSDDAGPVLVASASSLGGGGFTMPTESFPRVELNDSKRAQVVWSPESLVGMYKDNEGSEFRSCLNHS